MKISPIKCEVHDNLHFDLQLFFSRKKWEGKIQSKGALDRTGEWRGIGERERKMI